MELDIKSLLNKNALSDDAIMASVSAIVDTCSNIPANGEYDPSIIANRIGQYIYAIQECGKVLAYLGIAEKMQEIQVEKEFSSAALDRAKEAGFTTDGKAKLFAQKDEEYLAAKQKLIEIQGAVMYVENFRTSLDKAHLHCKKIIDRNSVEEKFANEHERFPASPARPKETNW